jgi:hypothetical protein
MERCPIPSMTSAQEMTLTRIVEYLICAAEGNRIHHHDAAPTGKMLLIGYLEQWVNALVYELLFPDKLHRSGLNFFAITEDLHLRPLSMLEGAELPSIQELFENVYQSNHRLRQSLFSLESVEEVRIIEGRA